MSRLRRKLRTWRRVVGLWIAGVDGRPVTNVINIQAEALNPDTVAEMLRQQAPTIVEIIAREARRGGRFTRDIVQVAPDGTRTFPENLIRGGPVTLAFDARCFGRTEEPA